MYELTFSTCLYLWRLFLIATQSKLYSDCDYFIEVVCKAIELLVTCQLVISGLKFPVLFPLPLGRKRVVAVSGNTLETRWTA